MVFWDDIVNFFQDVARMFFGGEDARGTVEGYTGRTSVSSGDAISFHLNASGAAGAIEFTIDVVKIGDDTTVHSGTGTAAVSETPPQASRDGCEWPPTYTLNIPPDWPSGIYRADISVGSQTQARIPFVVTPGSPGSSSRILVLVPDTTYQAYNTWGGTNLYGFADGNVPAPGYANRLRQVSFDRPFRGNTYATESSQLVRFLRWFAANGIAVEWCTGIDLHRNSDLLSNYQLLVSVGHDEYWSKKMRDHVEAFIDGGGNVAFFSGNTCWWQIRLGDEGRVIVCFKDAAEDPFSNFDDSVVTVNWSAIPVLRPENALTGVSFRAGAGAWADAENAKAADVLAAAAYTVRFAKHWVFEGTGLVNGGTFARGSVGYETDAAEFQDIDGYPRATGRDGTPPTFIVLATAELSEWEANGQGGRATMGLYRRSRETGTVFTAASVDWANGLTNPQTNPETDPGSKVDTITANVVNRLCAPAVSGAWDLIGHANDIHFMTARSGRLIAATGNHVLWARDPVGQEIAWQRIGRVGDMAALAVSQLAIGTDALFAVTNHDIEGLTLWWRDPDGWDWNWYPIGTWPDLEIVAMTATWGKLYAATSDNQLISRDAVLTAAEWETIGSAIDVVAMAAITDLFCVDGSNVIWRRSPDAPRDTEWRRIDEFEDAVALAATDGKLFVATSDDTLWWRDLD